MKRLIPILMLIGFLAVAMKPIGPYAEYLLNKEFIANNYCVNQDRPQMNCKGMCYLMKRVKAQAERSSDQDVLQIVVAPDFPVLPVSSFAWTPVQELQSKWLMLHAQKRDDWTPEPEGPPPRSTYA